MTGSGSRRHHGELHLLSRFDPFDLHASPHPTKKGGNLDDRIHSHRGRQSHPHARMTGYSLEPFKYHGKLGTPKIAAYVVNLIHYDVSNSSQMLDEPASGEQDLEGLRRGYEEIGRIAGLAGPLGTRRVPVSQTHTDAEIFAPFPKTRDDISVQCTERGCIDDPKSPVLRCRHTFSNKGFEHGNCRGFRLSDPGGSEEKGMLSFQYMPEGPLLGSGRGNDTNLLEQFPQPGM